MARRRKEMGNLGRTKVRRKRNDNRRTGESLRYGNNQRRQSSVGPLDRPRKNKLQQHDAHHPRHGKLQTWQTLESTCRSICLPQTRRRLHWQRERRLSTRKNTSRTKNRFHQRQFSHLRLRLSSLPHAMGSQMGGTWRASIISP